MKDRSTSRSADVAGALAAGIAGWYYRRKSRPIELSTCFLGFYFDLNDRR
jgi:hypothetical protein